MKIFTGTVISNKSKNTVRVLVEYQRPHPKYGKLMRQKTKLLAHNLLENVAEGDTVIIETCKPVSKNKFFKVREVVGKNKRPVQAKVLDTKNVSVKSDENPLKSEKTEVKKVESKIVKTKVVSKKKTK